MIPYSFLAIIGLLAALYLAALFDSTLLRVKLPALTPISIISYVASSNNAWKLFLLEAAGILMAIVVLILNDSKDYQSEQIIVTPDIQTPVPAGQGQCGTARWLDKTKFDEAFRHFIVDSSMKIMELFAEASLNDIKAEYKRITEVEETITNLKKKIEKTDSPKDEDIRAFELKQHELTDEEKIIKETSNPEVYDQIKDLLRKEDYNNLFPKEGGIVLGKRDISSTKELLYYMNEDIHTLILGATRAGKGRTILMQTIASLILAGESMIITDPKAESYYYFKKFLEFFEYNIITIDFKNPRKSTRFNYLQPIIDCIDAGSIPDAVDATWDLVSQLVGEPKGNAYGMTVKLLL